VRIIRKPLKVIPRKRLRTAAQRSAAKYAEEDYSAEEPNVKLSRAFVVVLLLHIVAVGGIFAFSALKDRQTGGNAEAANQKVTGAPGKTAKETGAADKPVGKTVPTDVQKLVDASHGSAANGSKTQNSSSPAEAGGESPKVYMVQKGDSPAGIAKKFKVNYADLLRTNNIEDPKKLQIGQKLVIP
jgi:LysM repeat protein